MRLALAIKVGQLTFLVAGESTGQPSPPSPDGEMHPDVKMDLEFILERNLKHIITKFAAYVDSLRLIVRGKGVTAEDLRSYLLSLPATSKTIKGQQLTLLSDKEDGLIRRENITTSLKNKMC